jgi:hypothetical protein
MGILPPQNPVLKPNIEPNIKKLINNELLVSPAPWREHTLFSINDLLTKFHLKKFKEFFDIN